MDHDDKTHARRIYENVRRKLLSKTHRKRSRQSFKNFLRAIVIRSFYQIDRRDMTRA